MEIVQAGLEHLEEVAKLFNQYRVFYQSSSDLEAARNFLAERFHKKDSVILAFHKNQCIV